MSIQSRYSKGSPQIAFSSKRWLPFFICLGLVLAVGIVFGQTIRFEFINYDDDFYIYENPVVTNGLSLHKIVWLFTHDNGRAAWFPLSDFTHMLAWQFFGPQAGWHHLINVLLHGATAILLFLVLRKMTGALWRSAFVAAVFAIHPLRVESVAWVIERKDVLSGLFFMLTVWMWVRYSQGRSKPANQKISIKNTAWSPNPLRWPRDYSLALLFFTLGLLSKSMLMTLPFVLLLLDYWPLNRFHRPHKNVRQVLPGLILEKMPFLLLSVPVGVITMMTQKPVVMLSQGVTLPWRIGNSMMAYVDYIGHMFHPVGLSLLYPLPEKSLPLWSVVLSGLILACISIGVIVWRRKYPYLLVGWFWYLVMFVPVIDFVQTGDQTRADRYTYLPQIGLTILIAWGVVELCGARRHLRLVVGAGATVALAGLMLISHMMTTYWKNSVSLWTHTLKSAPQSYVANCNLGIALAVQGKPDDATYYFERALQIKPNDLKVYNNLGKVLMTQGRLDEAIQHFEKAHEIDPDDSHAENNLGVALATQGKLNDAVRHYERSLQLQPDGEAFYNLGNALSVQGKLAEAAKQYEQALEFDSSFAEAHCNFGLLLARQGKLDEAIGHYQHALQIKPDYAEARNNLAGLLAAQAKLNESAQYYERALQINPNDVDALNNVGVILARQGKLDEAIQDFHRALELNPEDASTCNNLGIALGSQGKTNEAVEYFNKALRLAILHNNTSLAASISARLKTLQPALAHPSTGQP